MCFGLPEPCRPVNDTDNSAEFAAGLSRLNFGSRRVTPGMHYADGIERDVDREDRIEQVVGFADDLRLYQLNSREQFAELYPGGILQPLSMYDENGMTPGGAALLGYFSFDNPFGPFWQPPIITSAPPAPWRRSLPGPPSSRSSPAPPTSWSLPASPKIAWG